MVLPWWSCDLCLFVDFDFELLGDLLASSRRIASLEGDFVLDGELVALDSQGWTSFQLMQNSLSQSLRRQRRDRLALHRLNERRFCVLHTACFPTTRREPESSAEGMTSFSQLARFGPGRALPQAGWWLPAP